MTTLRRILSASLFVAVSSGSMFGSLIQQTFTLPAGGDSTSWNQSANINQFNTSLGTLQTIAFRLVANTTVTGAATDDNAGSNGTDSYTFSGDTKLTLGDATNTFIIKPSTNVTQTFNNQSFNSVMSVSSAPATSTSTANYSVIGSGCADFSSTAGCLVGSTGTAFALDPLSYLLYEGTGQIALTVNAQTFAAFSGPAYRNASGSGTADATVTVTYVYAPTSGVPEPTSMVLFGSALVGLGFLRRRSVSRK